MPLTADDLAALIDRHAVPLQLWIGNRNASAEDIVQEAFCRLAVMDPPPEQIAAWLYRVCRNLAMTENLASRRRKARERIVAGRGTYNADPAQKVLADEAARAVLELDDALREVIVARIWGQLTMEQVGVACDISTATASRRYAEALTQLHTLLERTCEAT